MNSFSKLHPSVLLTYFVCVIVFSCTCSNPIYVLLSFFGAAAYAVFTGGRSAMRTVPALAVPLVLAVGAFNFLFAHWGTTVLFTFQDTEFTLESLVYGFYQGTVFASVTLWLLLFGQILSSDKLLAVTGKAAPSLSLLFSMTLGFAERFEKNARQIREARAGLNLPEKRPLREALEQFSVLVTLSLEGSLTTADAMRARGYGKGRRKAYNRFSFCTRDGVFLFAVLFVFAVLLAVSASGGAQFLFDPQLQLISLNPIGVVGGVVFFFCPLLLDVTERLKWQFLKQKI